MVYSKPNFVEMLIPLGSWNRTGKLMRAVRFVTIHETSLGTQIEPAEKDMQYYINQVMHPPDGREFVGYHYLVTDEVVIRFLKDNEFTCHAGKFGNKVSIGVERLVNINTDFPRAIANQAMVTATLMEKHSIPLKNVVPHKYWPSTKTVDFKYWTNKECPARLLAGMYGGWQGFIVQVDKFYREKQFILELF